MISYFAVPVIFFTLEFIKIDYGTTNISSLASGGFTERFDEGKM